MSHLTASIDPEVALQQLAAIERELQDSNPVSETGQSSKKGKQPARLERPSYERQSSILHQQIEESHRVRPDQDSWPDLEEVESLLSGDDDDLSPREIRTALRGLVKRQEDLTGYVESSIGDFTAALEALTRKIEVLGIQTPVRSFLPASAPRPVFHQSATEISTYFKQGSTPPTDKACRSTLASIRSNVQGSWKTEEWVGKLSSGDLQNIRSNWNEGFVKALLEETI